MVLKRYGSNRSRLRQIRFSGQGARGLATVSQIFGNIVVVKCCGHAYYVMLAISKV